MKTFSENTRTMNDNARAIFGADINIVVAQHPKFGDTSIVFIISGARHIEAATKIFGKNSQLSVEEGGQSDNRYFYSVAKLNAS